MDFIQKKLPQVIVTAFIVIIAGSTLYLKSSVPELADGSWADAVNHLFSIVNGLIASVFFFDVSFGAITVDGPEGPKTVGIPFAVIWLVCASVFFTLKFKFVNIKLFKHAIDITRGKYDNPEDKGEVSHFKALATALSATVGLGNIAGVAAAVTVGGPGATFWMIVAGILGMTAKFTECTLSQIYRETRSDGHILGGPMEYLEKGMAEMGWAKFGKFLAWFFAFLCIGGSLGGGSSFQVNQALGALKTTVPFFAENGWVFGAIMAVLVGMVIIGGISRIADVASKIVPLMCGVYVVLALYILLTNIGAVPDAFGTIFSSAFSSDAMYGGFIGVLIMGFQRAAFSNEAGLGSAAIAHAAAKTKYPVQEGIVALLEPFIDTVIVCTMTALVIVITGAYDQANPIFTGYSGAALTSVAMGTAVSWFPYILTAATVLFAFSTMISWSYYGERATVYLFSEEYSNAYKVILVIVVFLGAISTSTNVFDFGDLMILGMGIPNIVGLYFLSGKVKKHLEEYMEKVKSGTV